MQIVPIAVAALIPMVMGFIWYNPAVFGKAWMNASGMTEEKAKSGNMLIIFPLMLLFSFFLSFALSGMVVHQSGMSSLFGANPDFADTSSEIRKYYDSFMASYGHLHRSFGHGALHGGIAAIAVALPIVGINALFERRGFKYIMIHVGYWFVSMLLMGGLICAWVV